MTLASHHHSSNSTSRSVGFVCVLRWLCVYVGNVCAISLDVKKKIESKGFTHQHLIQGQPVQCRPPFPWEKEDQTVATLLATSQTREQLRSENYVKSHLSACWDVDILLRMSWNFKGNNRGWGITSHCTQQEVEFSFFSLSLSSYQLTSKRSHGTWQPCRGFIASFQSLTAVLPRENKLTVDCAKEKKQEDWNVRLCFFLSTYLLLDNVT